MKFRDPVTTIPSLVAVLVLLAQSTGLLDYMGATAEDFGDVATKVVAAILALVAFFARDSDTMRRLPGARRLRQDDDTPTLYERATGAVTPKKP